LVEDPTIEAYRQALENYRHLANLRFAALTAFIAITGGLFAVALRKPGENQDRHRQDGLRFWFLLAAGLVIALTFSGSDWRIDELMVFFTSRSVALASQVGMSATAAAAPPQTFASHISGPVATQAVYLGSVAAWIVAGILKRRKRL